MSVEKKLFNKLSLGDRHTVVLKVLDHDGNRLEKTAEIVVHAA